MNEEIITDNIPYPDSGYLLDAAIGGIERVVITRIKGTAVVFACFDAEQRRVNTIGSADLTHGENSTEQQIKEDIAAALSDFFDPPLEALKEAKKTAVTVLKWSLIYQQVTYNGLPIRTDEFSLTKLAQAKTGNTLKPDGYVRDWKVASQHIALDTYAINDLYAKLDTFHQGHFTHEKNLYALIDGASNRQDLDAIDIQTGWPDPVLA